MSVSVSQRYSTGAGAALPVSAIVVVVCYAGVAMFLTATVLVGGVAWAAS